MDRIRRVHFPLKLTAKTANFKEKAASKQKDATKSVKTLQINIFLIKALKRKNQPAKGSKIMKKFHFNTFSTRYWKGIMYKTLRIACRHSKFLLFWK